ncbi:MAG TPA: hypothetical protein VII63_04480 [Caulobacteraceae bacterium]
MNANGAALRLAVHIEQGAGGAYAARVDGETMSPHALARISARIPVEMRP